MGRRKAPTRCRWCLATATIRVVGKGADKNLGLARVGAQEIKCCQDHYEKALNAVAHRGTVTTALITAGQEQPSLFDPQPKEARRGRI